MLLTFRSTTRLEWRRLCPIPWLDKNGNHNQSPIPAAFMDFKLVFKAVDEPVQYEDPGRQYRFQGVRAAAQLGATIRVPSIGFTFTTDRLNATSL